MFGTLWCNALLGAIGTFLIASSVCMWYYSHGPGQDLHLPILRSLGRVFRYHLGSLAFGALILAIIQFIELVVEVIKQQVTKAGADRSKAVEYVLSCVQCYLACLERVVAFLNKNAYIQIALRGKNFCMASKDGFEIIWSNPLRFGVVGGVGSVIMFIGKLLIASATTAIMWAIFNYTSWGTITSPLLPLLVICLLCRWFSCTHGSYLYCLWLFMNWLWILYLYASLLMRQIRRREEAIRLSTLLRICWLSWIIDADIHTHNNI